MIKNVILGNTDTNLLTATQETALLTVFICNTDTVEHSFSLNVYQQGSSPATGNLLVAEYTIPAKDTFVLENNEKLILQQGATVSGIADVTNKLTATLSYKEMV